MTKILGWKVNYPSFTFTANEIDSRDHLVRPAVAPDVARLCRHS